jgi:hypothetical protein
MTMNNNSNNNISSKDDDSGVRRVRQRSPGSFFSLLEATNGGSLPFMTPRRSSSPSHELSLQDVSRIIDMALAIVGKDDNTNPRQPKQ